VVKFPRSTFVVNIAKQGFTCTLKKKISRHFGGLVIFEGKKVGNQCNLSYKKKKASEKSTNYHYNSVHCLF